jgi:GT2 family glycosyltransferase
MSVGAPQSKDGLLVLAVPPIGLGSYARPQARGKFLYAGDEKLYVRGVTYGTFGSGEGTDCPAPELVARDFAQMTEHGVNAVRTYTVPPRWLLDLAHERGLWVMVGLAWEQHVAFLESAARARSIEQRVRAGVRACAGHPAVLCYAIGNEIPAPIVRWHGRRPVERFLARLVRAAREEDPGALVTYVNYPTTEYLQLPFVDLVCFNVYLEEEELLEAYLARLQNLAGDRPMLATELGLDSRRHGPETQAIVLGWQVRTAFAAGSAGAFVFSWTDEWHRGGYDIEDWDFGLVDRAREPKPGLEAVHQAFTEVPFREDLAWPRISVIVCSCNGARTLRNCLEGIAELDYPNFECVVVDDGSSDGTAAIAGEFDVTVLRSANEGLANARNRGLSAATGEIVAYIDDDARPDPHWLRYLAAAFMSTPHAAVGGPNIPPEGEGFVAECVAKAPGGPTHVLVADREAEHIPGCNMAFRREILGSIGGFDPQFRVAGDDVDICWRLHERGWTIGFSPAAVVWHRRRDSLRAYFRQQRGYGKAEALLERKWPDKYSRGGHPSWAGRVYGGPYTRRGGRRWRVYYGTWGSSLFQSIYNRAPGTLASLPLMPEWYLLIAVLAAASAYGLERKPLFFTIPGTQIPETLVLLVISIVPLVAQAISSAHAAWRHDHGGRIAARALTALLCFGQPLARLLGRLRHGLTPWRRRNSRLSVPRPRTGTVWCEDWRSLQERLSRLEAELRPYSTGIHRGSEFDRWDLQVRSGQLGAARLRLSVEEHGEGRQLLRYHVWPNVSRRGTALLGGLVALACLSFSLGSAAAVVALAAAAALLALRILHECAAVPPVGEALAAQGISPSSDIAEVLAARTSSKGVHVAPTRS